MDPEPSTEPSAAEVQVEVEVAARPARRPLEIELLTLFPAMLQGPLAESIPGRVQARGLAQIRIHDMRHWGLGRHKSVDDYTYGGGAGMVLRPEPVAAALDELRRPDSTVILLDPGGEVFGQARAHNLAERTHLILLCPRYEGVDERIRSLVDVELSIGDYVLSGGEIPALVVVDTVLRLLPGAIDAESTAEESFTCGLLEYPQYTRPPVFRDMAVPAVLTSGHHEAVRKWRLKESLRRTWRRRPELLEDRPMTREEASLLAEVSREESVAALEAARAAEGAAAEGASAAIERAPR
jgi:tRNA (guanine37-N1)-methyltransferase